MGWFEYFSKMLISWDFHAQRSLTFTQNGLWILQKAILTSHSYWKAWVATGSDRSYCSDIETFTKLTIVISMVSFRDLTKYYVCILTKLVFTASNGINLLKGKKKMVLEKAIHQFVTWKLEEEAFIL